MCERRNVKKDYALFSESLQGGIICSVVFIEACIDAEGADGYISDG
jgi:hypothetical protein